MVFAGPSPRAIRGIAGAVLAGVFFAGEGDPRPLPSASCAREDNEPVGFLQSHVLRTASTPSTSEDRSLDGSGWSLLNPNPDHLEWRFKGYFWRGKWSDLPTNATAAGRCILTACTQSQMEEFASAYNLKKADFRKSLVGYLKVPLEYDELKPSYNITLKLRISAFVGPAGADAPLILKHCGGPGSSDTCAIPDGTLPAVSASMTWFGIQQRGMADAGTSGQYPSPEHPVDIVGKTFEGVCEGRWALTPQRDANKKFTLQDFTSCVCDLPEDPADAAPDPFPDPTDEGKVQSWFAFAASRDRACYSAEYWKLTNGPHEYNFLDFVGTQLLAMDLDRFRAAVGHKKLHINGFSYGTAVGAAYMASFPEGSGRVVLNGNVHPGPGVDDYYRSVADACRQGMTKLVTICQRQAGFLPEETLARCQVPHPDPVAFFEEVVRRIQSNATRGSGSMYSARTWSGKPFTLTPEMLYHYLARLASGQAQSAYMWVNTLGTIVALGGSNGTAIEEASVSIFDVACRYQGPNGKGQSVTVRAWYDYGYCWPVMFNTIETNDNCITSRAVRAMDYVNRFTVTGAMDTYRRFARNFKPVEVYMANAKAGFGLQTWPGDAAPGMFGSRAGVTPVIINSLYDMSTPYVTAKLMREGFPNGVLVTWQGVGHTVGHADYDPEGVASCMALVNRYLAIGEMPTDGFTCHQSRFIRAAPTL